jgi:GAF domain-containing protein
MGMSDERSPARNLKEGAGDGQDLWTLAEIQARSAQLLRTVLWAGAGGALLILVMFIAVGTTLPTFPLVPLVPLVAGFLGVALVSMWLLNRGHTRLGAFLYLPAVSLGLVFAGQYMGGITGPLGVALIVVPVIAALLRGRQGARWTVLGVGALYGTVAVLERVGVLQPVQGSEVAVRATYHGMFLLTLAATTFWVARSTHLTEQALGVAGRREGELTRAKAQVEEVARAERQARERTQRIVGQLRQVVREYTALLQQVSAQDFEARLDLTGLGEGTETAAELLILGQEINRTVDTLVKTVADLRELQRRYVQEAWEGFSEEHRAARGYRYRGEVVEADDDAWLAPMEEAVGRREVAVDGEELALPITLRGEVIGALGLRRPSEGVAGGWSEAERAMAEAIGDQLAQTLESQRLLDETQRRATRERLISEVGGRVRESLDMETVLKTSADEVYRALGVDEVVVRLVPARHGDGRAEDEHERLDDRA